MTAQQVKKYPFDSNDKRRLLDALENLVATVKATPPRKLLAAEVWEENGNSFMDIDDNRVISASVKIAKK